MTISERVAEILAGVPIEDQIHGYPIEDPWIEDPVTEEHVVIGKGAATILGESVATTYRRVASGELGHIKIGDGGARKGKDGKARGRAGSVRIRLIDIVEFQVRNERAPGRNNSGPKAA